mmetsp:Transcript_116945/g.330912  ORF Transcript_116945/g.330912 Transcript_116945/m.330912 type:complete len:458 (-) Transcript_116945:72-1445(-)
MALVEVGSASKEVIAYGGEHELSETLREDGRLLRMFVMRNEHLKPDAQERAFKEWLIRKEFFDEWVEEFAKRYAAPLEEKEDDPNAHDLVEFESVFAARKAMAQVEKIEQVVVEAQGDVYMLRDALLAAVKDMSAPRRKLGLHGANAMTPEAIEALKYSRQKRLREVVFACLDQIWKSNVGGEVLRMALNEVHRLVTKYEDKDDDVRNAKSGDSWHKLKVLADTIETEIGGTRRRQDFDTVGKGHKQLAEKAIVALGGSGSTEEIFRWIKENPSVADECAGIKLNKRPRALSATRTVEVWQETVRTYLSKNCDKAKRKIDGKFVYCVKGTAETLPEIVEMQAEVSDAAQNCQGVAAIEAQASASDPAPAKKPKRTAGGAKKPAKASSVAKEPQGAAKATADASLADGVTDAGGAIVGTIGDEIIATAVAAADVIVPVPAAKRKTSMEIDDWCITSCS